MNHVLESQQFTRELLEIIFEKAGFYEKAIFENKIKQLATAEHSTMFSVFYEPSTRTRMSFTSAGLMLGMNVASTENARDFSSAIKGETLEDTIRVLCGSSGFNCFATQ